MNIIEQVVQSRFHRKRRSGCCGERDDRGMTGAGVTLVMAISGVPELHG